VDVTAAAVDLEQIRRFVYLEARLADEHDYDAWEALWTDDAIYWVPAGRPHADPAATMSVIYDNRTRISTRLQQLRTGRRHSQLPRSSLRRVVSNVEVLEAGSGDLVVAANFVLVEHRSGASELWAGRTTYRLRSVGGELRLSYKQVDLVNGDGDLPTVSFLI
jgi:3-phenylpropionate/cinnamic acid dioxygenase small subunit